MTNKLRNVFLQLLCIKRIYNHSMWYVLPDLDLSCNKNMRSCAIKIENLKYLSKKDYLKYLFKFLNIYIDQSFDKELIINANSYEIRYKTLDIELSYLLNIFKEKEINEILEMAEKIKINIGFYTESPIIEKIHTHASWYENLIEDIFKYKCVFNVEKGNFAEYHNLFKKCLEHNRYCLEHSEYVPFLKYYSFYLESVMKYIKAIINEGND